MTWLIYRYEEPMRMKFGTWFNMGEMEVNYGMMLDSLSMMVMVPVGIVTLCVLMYAMDYMRHDPNRNRFYIMLSVFAMFMTVLVVSENYLMMFIGWEFVGVVSYLLMSFWNTRMTAMKSGLSAITLNRMGDTFFVICLGILFNVYHAVDFETVELLTPHVNTNMLNMMALTLLLAATAKSAQLGLHGWLLSAMEGPTPVSALLHAATMVCSGVYVLVRSSFMLEYTPSMLLTMLWLGGITTLVSGLMAMVSNDIKKVMALSTMSQLAMMMLAMGMSAYDLAMYHLYCHAFFKALLFMSAGSMMHSYMSESQDMRKYGGLMEYLPFTYTNMLMASLSLMAMPGLTGYYSKDMMMESLYGSYTMSGYMIYYLAVASATLTAGYSMRVAYLTFFNTPRGNKYSYSFVHESTHMAIPMFILAIYSIFLGYYRDNVIFHLVLGLPHSNNFIETEYTLPAIFKLLPLILGIILSISIMVFYEYFFKVTNSSVYNFFNQRIYYDQLLNNIIIRSVLNLGGNLNRYVDNGTLRVTGSTGISRGLTYFPILIIINLLYLFM
uniref:NADH-ubiquinone oxidoreductase chain 5 n=1 Tax=Pichia sorbitophila (strain ATCC MYA-4447 / BCRC 22081 / CBS 7064 / NBRC 10061 / NRRL Y-12695) TaxID=559304 RepID=C7U022_PICSO|nr:NADH dehydrogenase subunit 5 [Millerozyma farinosa]CAY39278.1 NADH dehydrogenase, subunit 5 [Millerozyma farinosa]